MERNSFEDIEKIFTYQPPKNEAEIRAYTIFRHAAKMFAHSIAGECYDSLELNNAIDKVREAVMWANAAIAIHGVYPGDKSNGKFKEKYNEGVE